MSILCNNGIILLSTVKCITVANGGKLIVEYNDDTQSEIVFNAEPQASQALVQIATALMENKPAVEVEGEIDVQES